MPNLRFLTNVLHQGVQIPKDAIVSDAERDLSLIAPDLIDRGLVKETLDAATHSASLVDASQTAMPLSTAAAGAAPAADTQIAKDKAAVAETGHVTELTAEEIAAAEAKAATTPPPAPVPGPNDGSTAGPTAEEIAAAANSQN